MSSGSSRAESAVEATRSQNMTGSWHATPAASAGPPGGTGAAAAGGAGAGPAASAAAAFSRRLRCPNDTPIFFSEVAVRQVAQNLGIDVILAK